MTTDLTMLVWSTILCLLLAVPYSMALVGRLGLPVMAGNRENFPVVEGWIGRAKRAHMNMVENLVPFAALVLTAHVSGEANATTALGSQIFFWGRVGHAVVYYAGIPWVRTLAFAVSLVGEVMILVQILN